MGLLALFLGAAMTPHGAMADDLRVKVAEGTLEGTIDVRTGTRRFAGVPFAAPPVGPLRWREPQPAARWRGVRKADAFAPRPMQLPLYGDMIFRSPRVDEDCLYLNVWTPQNPPKKRLPVLVYFYGGGFAAGASDEVRYDGGSLAARGIVAVTVNYRLGVFGFLAHPELTKESPHHASGNYGLMDQAAALHWVRKNAAAFGGDPSHITIAGESAGSFSVSAQMASPLARDLIAGAIGESGATFGATLSATPLARAEENGVAFAKTVGAADLAALRAMPADRLLQATKTGGHFGLTLDGYFFPKQPTEIYAAGEQAHVPLLAGWNAAEGGAGSVLGQDSATPENFAKALTRFFGNRASEASQAYPATTEDEVKEAATDVASDRFIAFGTWKWIDLHARTGGHDVYRYYYAHPRPGEGGAVHSAEIEYALGNLDLNPHYTWTEDDRKVSTTMEGFFERFVKTGDPNGDGLPHWPRANPPGGAVMRIDVTSQAAPDITEARYRFLDSFYHR